MPDHQSTDRSLLKALNRLSDHWRLFASTKDNDAANALNLCSSELDLLLKNHGYGPPDAPRDFHVSPLKGPLDVECESCGAKFTTTNHSQSICNSCAQPKPTRLARWIKSVNSFFARF